MTRRRETRSSAARWPLAAVLPLAACAGPQHVLDPRGPAAERIAELWWLMLGLATAVTLGVVALLAWATYRGMHRAEATDGSRAGEGHRLIWAGGVGIPLAIVFLLVVRTARVGVEAYQPSRAEADALVVDVVGHKFWWEVRYPQHGITTANEIYIPTGEPVLVRVSSPDVIHSFWVPQLHGKVDMIPGRTNALWIEAREPGTFRGQCAEYCGHGHALMAFWVAALAPAEFEAWLRHRAADTAEPDEVRFGRQVFFEAGCGLCHATRGAPLPPAFGAAGPDLTDFARRRTIAAGTRPNNRGNLAAWILDPQRIKPGSRMPATPLEADRLQALLDYLETLR